MPASTDQKPLAGTAGRRAAWRNLDPDGRAMIIITRRRFKLARLLAHAQRTGVSRVRQADRSIYGTTRHRILVQCTAHAGLPKLSRSRAEICT